MDAAAAAAAAPFGRTYGGMLKHLATLLWSYPRWRLLLGFYGAVFTVATVRGATRKKAPKRAKKAAKKQSAAPKSLGKGFKAQFTTLIKIAIPGWTSTAALRLYAYTLMNLLRAYLNIQLVLVGSTGIQRIAEMDWHKMFYQQSIYMSLCAPLALLNAIMRYVQNRIALDMRTNLLEFVHANYLDRDATFYRMSAVGKELLSTLDQRCTADIEEFAMDTALLYGNIVKPAIGVNKNTACSPLTFRVSSFSCLFLGFVPSLSWQAIVFHSQISHSLNRCAVLCCCLLCRDRGLLRPDHSLHRISSAGNLSWVLSPRNIYNIYTDYTILYPYHPFQFAPRSGSIYDASFIPTSDCNQVLSALRQVAAGRHALLWEAHGPAAGPRGRAPLDPLRCDLSLSF
jgi:hypothetical protein